MLQHLSNSLKFLLLFTLLTGLAYPLLVTAIAKLFFPHQANGSLITKNQTIIGSELIGQHFEDPKLFWSRPSATSPFPYNASASSGSNLAQTNKIFIDNVQNRIEALKTLDPKNSNPIPSDLLMSSASGLDPHISLEAAKYQVPRISKARNVSEEKLLALIERVAQGRRLILISQPRVNVLKLNLHLTTEL